MSLELVDFAHRVPVGNATVDEAFIRGVVAELKQLGFPASEGYYLVLLTPKEALELRAGIKAKLVAPARAYLHSPAMLFTSMTHIGARYVCTLGDAVIGETPC